MKLGLLFSPLVALSVVLLAGCPQGTRVSGDLDVRITPDACHEDPTHAAALNARGALTDDLISLACSSLEGGIGVHVEFPRAAWHQMLERTDAGAGATKSLGK